MARVFFYNVSIEWSDSFVLFMMCSMRETTISILVQYFLFQWITKSIAISIAWYIQSIQSAFTSALIGGLMIARSFCNFCYFHKIELGGLIKENHEDTVLDETLSYVFAALGFYFQFMIGFKVPAPFNMILFPFGWVETWIRWSITKKAGGGM